MPFQHSSILLQALPYFLDAELLRFFKNLLLSELGLH